MAINSENLSVKFHQWFKVPYRLHTQSRGSGPVVILLHGIATSGESWQHLRTLLEHNFKCISIDLVGFGKSPKPEWYSYTPAEHVRNIELTINKLNQKSPFILVGHSMGALLAAHYTARNPARVRQLFLLSPPLYFGASQVQAAKRLWRETALNQTYKYLRTHKNFTLKGATNLKKFPLKNNPFMISEETWLAFSKSLEECIEKQNFRADIEQIHCPINIIYGSLDQLLVKKNIKQLGSFDNVKIQTLRAAHTINLAYAAFVAREIIKNS